MIDFTLFGVFAFTVVQTNEQIFVIFQFGSVFQNKHIINQGNFRCNIIDLYIMQSVHKVNIFQCPSCEHKATKKSSLKIHMQSIHGGN